MAYTTFKRTGEPPVIMDSAKTTKSLLRLKYFYFNDGYFDVKTSAAIDTLTLSAAVKLVTTGAAYALDTIKTLFLPCARLVIPFKKRTQFYNQVNNIKRSILKKNEIVYLHNLETMEYTFNLLT
jgi:hypothetical protein